MRVVTCITFECHFFKALKIVPLIWLFGKGHKIEKESDWSQIYAVLFECERRKGKQETNHIFCILIFCMVNFLGA